MDGWEDENDYTIKFCLFEKIQIEKYNSNVARLI